MGTFRLVSAQRMASCARRCCDRSVRQISRSLSLLCRAKRLRALSSSIYIKQPKFVVTLNFFARAHHSSLALHLLHRPGSLNIGFQSVPSPNIMRGGGVGPASTEYFQGLQSISCSSTRTALQAGCGSFSIPSSRCGLLRSGLGRSGLPDGEATLQAGGGHLAPEGVPLVLLRLGGAELVCISASRLATKQHNTGQHSRAARRCRQPQPPPLPWPCSRRTRSQRRPTGRAAGTPERLRTPSRPRSGSG